MITYKGYGWPLFGGHQNVMSRQSGDRLIKNDLLQLILTAKGERVMRPSWGTILKSSVFSQSDDVISQQITQDISDAIITYEPRVRATVAVSRDDDAHILNVVVSGAYTDQPNTTFEVELNIPFEQLEK